MQKKHKIIIVGAGPIGLYLASLCQEKGIDYLLLESSDHVGGQLINLYPEKDIIDIPGIESIKAKDYIALLMSKIDPDKVRCSVTVQSISKYKEDVKVITSDATYVSEYIALATGLGFSKPRPMGVEGEENTPNIIYSIKDYNHLKNKRVAILGGGDSALDWAKTLSKISDGISLIHRRTEFRGNPETIKGCKNLAIYLPYVPYSITKENGLAKVLTIEQVETKQHIDIPVDYIFVNYGNIPASTQFELDYDANFVKVDEHLFAAEHIFAIGDLASYENKKRRIAPGNEEARKIINIII